ncbi:MAG: hypothetical protein QF805_26465, partial [Pirellulaceae bacterium]|nr:hypothetical protein [Pirellulaceae bacterium]
VRALANNFLSAGDFHRAWNLVSAPNGSSPALDDFSVQLLFANRRHGELIGARPFVPDEVHFAGHSWKMAAHALARENGAVADQFVAFVDEQARFLADAAAVSLTAEMVAERRDLAMFRDYLNRDFKSIATQIENDPNESDNFWNAVVELEQGRVAAADAAFGDNLDLRGADMLLALSAAWRSEGSVDDAQRRKSEWIEFSLTNALSPNGRIAQLLKRESQPSVDDIRDTLIKPAVKRLVALLVASELPPAEREPYLQLAERYNFYPSAPHFFVVQLAEKLRGESR